VVPKPPYGLDSETPSLNSPSPTLGKHSAPVLMRVLGLTSDDIAMLERDGMIGMKPV
jgi:crotonobetainyl-CoA:carnitine CoA-transferase CaiB-like acyl-CoA transferase